MSLALAVAYGAAVALPFIAPLFALILTAAPGPPMGAKRLLVLTLVVMITLGVGLLLIPLLINYPVTGFLVVAVGIYFSNYLTVNLSKGGFAILLTMGITLISAAGTLSYPLAVEVIQALVIGVTIATLCQWLVYPLFPEDEVTASPAAAPTGAAQNNWIALRATIVVLPVYFVVLTNPAAYLPIIMKSVSLGQQASEVHARHAGRELLGSTFMGGCLAIVFWFALGIEVSLWMFFLWMLLFMIFLSSRLYQLVESRWPPSFWQNAIVTMLILLGSAVQDSATGKDVYKAFAVRMGLFIAVTIYAWGAVFYLEVLRNGLANRSTVRTA